MATQMLKYSRQRVTLWDRLCRMASTPAPSSRAAAAPARARASAPALAPAPSPSAPPARVALAPITLDSDGEDGDQSLQEFALNRQVNDEAKKQAPSVASPPPPPLTPSGGGRPLSDPTLAPVPTRPAPSRESSPPRAARAPLPPAAASRRARSPSPASCSVYPDRRAWLNAKEQKERDSILVAAAKGVPCDKLAIETCDPPGPYAAFTSNDTRQSDARTHSSSPPPLSPLPTPPPPLARRADTRPPGRALAFTAPNPLPSSSPPSACGWARVPTLCGTGRSVQPAVPTPPPAPFTCTCASPRAGVCPTARACARVCTGVFRAATRV